MSAHLENTLVIKNLVDKWTKHMFHKRVNIYK